MVFRHKPPGPPLVGRLRETRIDPSLEVSSRDEGVRQVQFVGRRMRRLRKDRRLSVADLAAEVGLQTVDLARLEKGEYRVSLDVLFRLLAALATSVEEFFEGVAREAAAAPEVVREI